MKPSPYNDFLKKVFIAVSVVMGFVIGLLVLFYAADVFLLLFAGILFSVFLKGCGYWIQKKTRFSKNGSILIVVMLLILLVIACFKLFIPVISSQINELSVSLPKSVHKASEALMGIGWLHTIVNSVGIDALLPSGRALIGKTAPFITTMLGGLAGFLVMIITGFYFAMQAETYSEGFLKLIPVSKRKRVREFFIETEIKLQGWLFGQFLSMVCFGILITIGLSFLKIPLALILGVIAALLAFIPNVGFVLSLIPAVLIGFADSPHTALSIIFLYIGANIIESYFFTPWVQFRVVSLPPILVIFSQIVIGLLFGFLGLVLATPLTLVVCNFVRYFYVEDILGEKNA